MTFGLLAACGSEEDSPRTPKTGTSGAQARTLTATALEQAAIKGPDLDGYEVERSFTSVGSSHKATDEEAGQRPSCRTRSSRPN